MKNVIGAPKNGPYERLKSQEEENVPKALENGPYKR